MKKVFKDKIFDIDHILTFRKPVERDNKYKKMNPKGIKLHIAKTQLEIAPMIKTFPKRADFFREYIDPINRVAVACKLYRLTEGPY